MRHLLVLLLALTGSITCRSQDHAPPFVRDALSKPSQNIREGRMRVTDALAVAFSTNSLAGGLQLTRCGRQESLIDVKDHASLTAIINQVTAAALHSKVEFPKEGTINLSLPGTTDAFLETRIGATEIDMPEHNAAVAVAALLSLPEVELAAQTAGLTEVSGPFGFSHLPRPGAVPKIDRILLNGATLRDALNEIAHRLGNGFWVYEEDSCSERRTFAVSFRVD